MKVPILSRVWPLITAYAKTILASTDAATARTNLGLGTGDSPTFAGATIGGVGVNAATTAATIYVDSTGSNSTGARGNPSKPYLTAQAAYNAAEVGDTIKLGYGTFNVAGVADKTVLWVGPGYEAFTVLNLTYTGAHTTLPDGMAFTDFYDVEIGVTTSSPTFALPSLITSRDSTVVLTLLTSGSGIALDLNDCVSSNYGFGGLTISHIDTGATTTGAMTFKGGTTAGATLYGADAGTEAYLIALSGGTAIYGDAGVAKGGEINAWGCYGASLTAATVRMKNTGYSSLDYTTLTDGGGNRNEGSDIDTPVQPAVATKAAFTLGGTSYYPHVAAGVLTFTSTP